MPESKQFIVQAEKFAPKASEPYTNYTGNGFIALTPESNRTIIMTFEAPAAGKYLIDARYSNGTGPWNTDNNCGIRSLYINEEYQGVWVFPQRGTDEWSDWGYSNAAVVELKEGINEIKLSFETWNTNMDGEINTAMLDHLRLLQL